MDFETIKILVYLGVGGALFFALLYHYWSLEEADE
jgi:hypothetical protein